MRVRIWCTYDLAGSLHAGGLERVRVWFSKPEYHFVKNTRDWEDEDLPFGDENGQRDGCQRKLGWRAADHERGERDSLSFGKVFGYGEGIPTVVWGALVQHFGDPELRHWSDIEKAGKARAEDFLLELEVEMEVKGQRDGRRTKT